ncbi:hypothetical protein CJP72_24300 [Citrobacter sp. NCU1]|nr:hypothetical protein [Citrobacter sp. NCU1]
MFRLSLHYSDQDNPSIRLGCQPVKQIFLLNALIAVNLLAKKLTDLLQYLKSRLDAEYPHHGLVGLFH